MDHHPAPKNIQDSALQRYFSNRIIALFLHFTNYDILIDSICFLVTIIRNWILECFVGLECQSDAESFDHFGASRSSPTTIFCEKRSTDTNISSFILSYYIIIDHYDHWFKDDHILLLLLLLLLLVKQIQFTDSSVNDKNPHTFRLVADTGRQIRHNS